jgi:hypothetical protein
VHDDRRYGRRPQWSTAARFRAETALAALAAAAALVTVLWRDWIELVLGVDPDRGSGALEVAIVWGLAALAAGLAVAARADWRRLVAAGDAR